MSERLFKVKHWNHLSMHICREQAFCSWHWQFWCRLENGCYKATFISRKATAGLKFTVWGLSVTNKPAVRNQLISPFSLVVCTAISVSRDKQTSFSTDQPILRRTDKWDRHCLQRKRQLTCCWYVNWGEMNIHPILKEVSLIFKFCWTQLECIWIDLLTFLFILLFPFV